MKVITACLPSRSTIAINHWNAQTLSLQPRAGLNPAWVSGRWPSNTSISLRRYGPGQLTTACRRGTAGISLDSYRSLVFLIKKIKQNIGLVGLIVIEACLVLPKNGILRRVTKRIHRNKRPHLAGV